jgi:hypothetical protein
METTVREHPDEMAGLPVGPIGRVLGTATVLLDVVGHFIADGGNRHYGIIARHRVRTGFFKRRRQISVKDYSQGHVEVPGR